MAGEDNRAPEGPPETPWKPGDRAILFLIFLFALLVRAVAAWASGVASPQEIRYITIAQGILSGHGFNGIDARFPDLIQPPLYPLVLVLALLPGLPALFAARGVTALIGALLVFPISALTRRIFGRETALRTGWILVFYPLLVAISSISVTEPLFSLLVAVAVLRLFHTFARENERRNVAIAGLLLGLGFLTRPEGVADIVTTSLLLFYWALIRRKRTVRQALTLAVIPALVAFLVVAPYWIWLHGRAGRWLFAPKIALTEVHQSIMNRGLSEKWKEPYGSTLFYERVKFGLTGDGRDFMSSQAFRNLGLIDDGGPRTPDGGAVHAAARVETSHLVMVVLRNFRQLYLDTIKYGLVLPTLLLMFLALGVTARPWRPGPERYGQAILVWYALSGCSWILSYVQHRFLYPSMVFVIPWMAEGWKKVDIWIEESLEIDRFRRPRLFRRLIDGGLLATVAVACLIHVLPAVQLFSSTWSEHRTAGQYLRDSSVEKGSIMALTPVASFYSGFPFEMLPYAEPDKVIDYARQKGARYLLVDMAEFPIYRPQLMSFFDAPPAPEGLSVLHDFRDRPGRRIIIYDLRQAAGPPSEGRE